MRKILLQSLFFVVMAGFMSTKALAAGEPVITSPADALTNLALKFTIFGQSTSTGNSSSSKDIIYLEISKSNTFSPAQGSPDYQKSGTVQKSDDNTLNLSYSFPASLSYSTTYFIRAVSSKNGAGPVISITTGSQSSLQAITAPADGSTGVSITPTITGVSNSKGNTSELVYIEISKLITFDPLQGSPDYQKSGNYVKTNDNALNLTFNVTTQLSINTTYYARVFSNKNGASAVFSFTTTDPSSLQSITSPTEGQTNRPTKPTIQGISTSTGNSVSLPDIIYIEVSKSNTFSPSQGSPDYQKSGNYSKTNDSPLNLSYNVLNSLSINTVYYTRVVSSKNGTSAVVSFTTGDPSTWQFITAPTTGQTGVAVLPTITATSNSTGNTSFSETLYLEVSKLNTFSPAQGSPDYQKSGNYTKSNDATLNMSFTLTSALTHNTVYYARVVSSKNGTSAVVSFTTAALTAPAFIQIDNVNVTTNPYANKLVSALKSTVISGATSYIWEFDISGTFASPAFTTSSATNILSLNSSTLLSGQAYWVRLKASDGVLESPYSTPVQFYNALHQVNFVRAGNFSTATSFKLWTNHVDNATTYVFQVSRDKNFTNSFHSNPAPYNNLNSTSPGVVGNVFISNQSWHTTGGFTGNDAVTHEVFNLLYQLSNGVKYYFRVKALNSNQSGYWSASDSLTVNVAARAHTVNGVANNATGVSTNLLNLYTSNDFNYIETSTDFQVSLDAGFTSLVYNIQNQACSNPNNTANISAFQLNNLKYNTSYWVRTRSYINNSYPSNPSAWSTAVKFTTEPLSLTIQTPTEGAVLTNLSTFVVANTKYNVTSYEWELEQLTPTPTVTPLTSALNSFGLKSYAVPSGTYRVRVRGTVSSQSLTSAWSPYVNFSFSPSASRVGADETQAQAAFVTGTLASPNPFRGATTITIKSSYDNASVHIMNATGQNVATYSANGGQSIEIGETLTPGLYFVKIGDGESSELIKIIKE